MRAFITIRHLQTASPDNKIEKLQQDLKELREYVEEVFTDQNDINEDTRIQMEMINRALEEFQVKHKAAESVKCPPMTHGDGVSGHNRLNYPKRPVPVVYG